MTEGQKPRRQLPMVATEAAESYAGYAGSSDQLLIFLFMVEDYLREGDAFSDYVRRRIEGMEGLPDWVKEYHSANATEAYSATTHWPLIAETLVARAVDNFLGYLTDLLRLIMLHRPEALAHFEESGGKRRGPRSVPITTIVQHKSLENLLKDVATEWVDELAFKPTRRLASFFKRIGLPLFPNPKVDTQGRLAVEIRNVIVHARGIVTEDFKELFPDYPVDAGKPLSLELDEARQIEDFLWNVVLEIDGRAAQKFALPTKPVKQPPVPER